MKQKVTIQSGNLAILLALLGLADLEFSPMLQLSEQDVCIFLDPAKTLQKLLGIGASRSSLVCK
jgi:hypothetical protein